MSNIHNTVNDLKCMPSPLKAKAVMIQESTCRVGSQGYLPSYRLLFLSVWLNIQNDGLVSDILAEIASSFRAQITCENTKREQHVLYKLYSSLEQCDRYTSSPKHTWPITAAFLFPPSKKSTRLNAHRARQTIAQQHCRRGPWFNTLSAKRWRSSTFAAEGT